MRLMGIDLGVFTETKLVDGTYTREAEGYEVVATEAKSNHQEASHYFTGRWQKTG